MGFPGVFAQHTPVLLKLNGSLALLTVPDVSKDPRYLPRIVDVSMKLRLVWVSKTVIYILYTVHTLTVEHLVLSHIIWLQYFQNTNYHHYNGVMYFSHSSFHLNVLILCKKAYVTKLKQNKSW